MLLLLVTARGDHRSLMRCGPLRVGQLASPLVLWLAAKSNGFAVRLQEADGPLSPPLRTSVATALAR